MKRQIKYWLVHVIPSVVFDRTEEGIRDRPVRVCWDLLEVAPYYALYVFLLFVLCFVTARCWPLDFVAF